MWFDNSNIVIVSNTKDLHLRKLKKKEVSSNTATMFGNPKFYLASTGQIALLQTCLVHRKKLMNWRNY